jgi:hypothetical protein
MIIPYLIGFVAVVTLALAYLDFRATTKRDEP